MEDPELLEAIRLTILNNMITYHPVRMLLNSPILFWTIVTCAFQLTWFETGFPGIKCTIGSRSGFWTCGSKGTGDDEFNTFHFDVGLWFIIL